jgi:hypothetical protein
MDYLADRQGFDNAAYLAWLATQGLNLPRAEAFLPRVLARYLETRHGAAPGG